MNLLHVEYKVEVVQVIWVHKEDEIMMTEFYIWVLLTGLFQY